MSKLTLAAIVSGLALSLASPVFVQAATPANPPDADQPRGEPQGTLPAMKPDTRSDKDKARGAAPKGADQPRREPKQKLPAEKPDTRSDKDKAAGGAPKGAD